MRLKVFFPPITYLKNLMGLVKLIFINTKMLSKIKLESLFPPIITEVEKIKKSIQFLQQVSNELGNLSGTHSKSSRHQSVDRTQIAKNDFRQKIRTMGANIDEMIAVLDFKITQIVKQISKIQKRTGQSNAFSNSSSKLQAATKKMEEQHKYKICQFEQRIFELQKKQNQYVKQISELKISNSKLRQQFSNLSFDSNQRIKELSEKIHNNTSPNLGIKRNISAGNPNPQISQIWTGSSEEYDLNLRHKMKSPNSCVKVKPPIPFKNNRRTLEEDNKSGKVNTKNMLDSLSSESSQHQISALGLGYPNSTFQSSNGNLKFGCFPDKRISEKAKTGSSRQQSKAKRLQEKNDKNRRFQFLLSNLQNPQQINEQPGLPFQNQHQYQQNQQNRISQRQKLPKTKSQVGNGNIQPYQKYVAKNSFFNNEVYHNEHREVKRYQI